LAEQPDQLVARVPTTAPVEQFSDRHVGEPEGVVELAVGEQAAIGGDPGAVELELDPAVENGPQRELFGFTRCAPHVRDPSLASNTMIPIAEVGDHGITPSTHLGNPGLVEEWGRGAVVRWLYAIGLEPERIAFLNMALLCGRR
jgi:hypothetical protein